MDRVIARLTERRAAILVGLALIVLPLSDRVRRGGLVILALIFLAGAALGAYHAGVEWDFWPGPADCGGAAPPAAGSMADFRKQLETTRVVSCTEAAFRARGLRGSGGAATGADALRLELGVPVQIVHPALVQVVRREQAAVAVEVGEARGEGRLARPHLDLAREAVALPEIAGRAGSDDVLPGRVPALRARDEMVEGQVLAVAAILAGEAVAKEDVESREGGVARRLDVGLERDDGGEPHLEARTSDRLVVFGDDVHPLEEHGLDRVLPAPDRQGIVAQRPVIGVEDERRAGFRPHHWLDMDRHATSSLLFEETNPAGLSIYRPGRRL